MSTGKVHAATSATLSVPCAIAVGIITGDVVMAMGAGLGCLIGIILTPDLDLVEAQVPWWGEVLSVLLWILIFTTIL